ncbi:NADH-FMN oxidoreductase RutF, flavin reductase (DIM6/NTAB) family [Shimia gijangensis]|uniref:NADH-FMN oxidoreductase RutF, flavin reductase (DIM6/NTAB) family n=1 Tax=Shimia gijangensis TaxID=1470563 RepID=A0A1M6TFG1_9RHOB|nr:flavin reductase family protein [Shimia gijangensis]SHK55619.1 NADH-FMN oxidoreductase RutF, flavin reductase (DIM6/NTAB) family [Shimia gijangensis]
MVRKFVPDDSNTRDFRDALGCFATGVTVITAPSNQGGIGMTANSFSSISLTPPLVLWSPSKRSLRYDWFRDAAHFAIHVLRSDQKHVALEFARRGDAFDVVPMTLNARGVPLMDDCLARFECATSALHDGGDHAIIVGHVDRVLLNDGSPLVFAQSGYGAFSPNS